MLFSYQPLKLDLVGTHEQKVHQAVKKAMNIAGGVGWGARPQ